MHGFDIALAVVGGLVVGLGLLSRALQARPVSTPLVAFLAGMALGPHGFAVSDPEPAFAAEILEQAARVVLAIGVMGIALGLPAGYLRRNAKSLAVLLGAVMPLMAGAAAGVVHFTLGLAWTPALLVGAIAAPTDPIVGRSVVTGDIARRNLPERLRNALLCESGANDGAAFPLVLLPLVIGYGDGGWTRWLVHVLLWQVGGAIVAGALLGFAAGRALRWAEKRRLVDGPHFLSLSIALSLLALGGVKLLDMDGLLAVFVAGLAFARGCRTEHLERQREVQDAVNELAMVAIFVLFGMLAPWPQWLALGWPAVAMLAGVFALRRLPWVFLLQRAIPAIGRPSEAGVAGWLGPVGVGAIFYGTYSLRRAGEEAAWGIPSLIVAASVVVYALSAAPLARHHGRATGRARAAAD